MDTIKYPGLVDFAAFSRDAVAPQALYGLPESVGYCKRCVISNQRPNSAVEYKHVQGSKKVTINFDENGVCDACNFAEP